MRVLNVVGCVLFFGLLLACGTGRKRDDLTIDKASCSSVNDGVGIYISGVCKYTGKTRLKYVQVTFGLYDARGRKVGNAIANVGGLEPGGSWSFRAVGVAKDATRWELDSLTGY